MLLLVGAAIVFLPRVFPNGLPVRGYGLMVLTGIVCGVGLAMYRAHKGGLDPEAILSLAIWLVVTGVIGARLFFVVEYWNEKYAGKNLRDTIVEIVNVPEGGLVIYGGFLGAMVGFVIFVRKHGLPALAMADLIAPSMMAGLAFGRIGCLLNGCCYGGQTDWPWHVSFPQESPPYIDQAWRGELHGFRLESGSDRAVRIGRVDPGTPPANAGLRAGDVVTSINGAPIKSVAEARVTIKAAFTGQRPLWLTLASGRIASVAPIVPPSRSRLVHPTQIYSAIDAGLLAWLLWVYFPFRRYDGQGLALMLTIHPITRFLLEIIRTDEPAVFGTGLSISQNISVLLLAAGIGLWWYTSRQSRGITWPLASVGPLSRGEEKSARRAYSAGSPPQA
jgi:phosphatidylglycerol:prolipoprotein diacylglycerol transferase